MSNAHLLILLALLFLAYQLAKQQQAKADYQSHNNQPPPPAKKPHQHPAPTKINRAEDDPLINPPNISYHPIRIQTLIQLMWTDLNQMIAFKN